MKERKGEKGERQSIRKVWDKEMIIEWGGRNRCLGGGWKERGRREEGRQDEKDLGLGGSKHGEKELVHQRERGEKKDRIGQSEGFGLV